MSMVTGTVGWVGQNKFGKYSIKLDGNETWYNSNYEIKAQKGDVVEFDDGGKKYCQKLKVINSSGAGYAPPTGKPASQASGRMGPFPIPAKDGQRSIIRQNAVTNANALLGNHGEPYTVEDLLQVASEIEKYTSGDLDVEKATARASLAFEPEE